MSSFSISVRTTNLGVTSPSVEFIGAPEERIYLWQVLITLAATNGGNPSTFALAQPAVKGSGPSYLAGVPEDQTVFGDNFPSFTMTWASSAPTYPSNFFRQSTIDDVVGNCIVWEFPNGLVVPSTSSLVLFNVSAVGAADVSFTWGD